MKADKVPAVPVSNLPGKLPREVIPDGIDFQAVLSGLVNKLNYKIDHTFFREDSWWRDLCSLTGSLRALHGAKTIAAAWAERTAVHMPVDFKFMPGSIRVIKRPDVGWIQGMYQFSTTGPTPGRCSGIIGAVPPKEGEKDWKCWMLATVLEQNDGMPNVDVYDPIAPSVLPGDKEQIQAKTARKKTAAPIYSTDIKRDINGPTGYEIPPDRTHFDAVVVGGGQAGLCILGRLKAGGVHNCIALEKYNSIGGNWQDRYDSVKLHTSKDISQLPFGKVFPREDPYYLGKKHIVKGYQTFCEQFRLHSNLWLATTLKRATYNEGHDVWVLELEQPRKCFTITCRHLVLAIGGGGSIPKTPNIPNREVFQGTDLHSIAYMNAWPWKGKKVVIIGTANTGHDIAEDCLEAGVKSVTLVQRNPTCIVPAEYQRDAIEPLYNADTNIELADRGFQGVPCAVTRLLANEGLNGHARNDPERFEALERRGFKVIKDIDFVHILYERLGGHYMDVGASALVADGSIKVKSGASIKSFTETGLAFDDGDHLEADIVLYATGFDINSRDQIAALIGEEMEQKTEDQWKCDKEGEMRGLWRPIGHPTIWYAGGGIGQTRFYSRFLALQIQADLAGKTLPIYLDTPDVA
ncbi:putative flavin-containing monooxygenase [Rhizodiscina lignyota]|uniref:Flavin-containing monooxygenase n=1 Tax=Rhizodiscina lignyota TaxID=1504668 RepID=A0A9P4M596_9PEZI|nr:putative flavin-containing monooxygenase [Rhizodiscina lignyota]